VLQVIPDLGGGGAERMLLNLVVGLDRARFDVDVVSLYARGSTPVEAELAQAGVRVTHLGKKVGFDPSMTWRIHGVIRSRRPDVVHTHRAVLQYALPALVLWRRRKVVHTVHNVAPLEVPRPGRIAHRLAFGLGVNPVAIGEVVAASFRREYGREPCITIPNGIPVGAYASPKVPRAEWRRRNGIAEGQFLFVTTARLQPQKNIALLLRAMRSLRGSAAAALAVAGDGPLRDELHALSAMLGIADRVRFLGSRSDVPDLLAAGDAFVLSSDWEGNPLSVMEAMAAGVPVVATRVGGVPEIVGGAGVLTEPGDESGLAAAMRALVEDRARRDALSRAARARAAAEFDASRMASRYASLYERLVAADVHAS
jgi:glycosyltransferase involved in cell wall biosynthesis